jgi:hypothetical protein
MEGVLREDRRKSLRVLNWAIRLTQTIRSQPRGRLATAVRVRSAPGPAGKGKDRGQCPRPLLLTRLSSTGEAITTYTRATTCDASCSTHLI